MLLTEQNKEVVLRFNKEFMQQYNVAVLNDIVADDFTNHTAAGNFRKDKQGLIDFVGMMHKGFSEFAIEIFEQVAENDLVATRKIIRAKHTGEIMGKQATNKDVEFNVIDMVRLRDGKYIDHWGRNDVMQVIQSL